MKQTLLVLWVFCALAAAAQQSGPALSKNQLALGAPPTNDFSGVASTLADPPAQESKPAPAQKKNPPLISNPPVEIKRPIIDASMVGYIDNAIVGSEVRIRFDAAFNNDRPDRAEFIYGKCGCYRNPPPVDPNSPGPGPGVPQNINFQVLSFMGEYAPTRRFSGFIEIPVRWLQPQGEAVQGLPVPAFPNGAGISDLLVGLKFALLASPTRYLTAQLKTYFPSGDGRRGLGTSHYSLEPALLYYQRFGESERFEMEGELGGWLPIGGSATQSPSGAVIPSSSGFAGNIFFYGIGPSYRLVDHEQFRLAPVIELVGWNVTGGQETGGPLSASGTNIVNLKIGARMSFHSRDSVYVGYGVALTSADWYNDIVRVEYRHTF